MGEITDKFARALNANAERDKELRFTNKALEAQTSKLAAETTLLDGLAARMEDKVERSKWDWITLAAGMAVAAALAGGGTFFVAKATIEKDDFQRSVQLISQDDDASWCGFANAPIIQDRYGTSYRAIAMPKYQKPEQTE